MNAEQLLERATMNLVQTEPFWAVVQYQLERGRVAVGPEVCEIAATDGKGFFYNKAGIESLTFGQVRTVVAHEGCHLAFFDHVWLIDKELELGNIATDHVINNILEEGGFEPIPGWLCDHRFKGQTKDQVYQTLERERNQQKGGGGKQPPPPQQQQQPGGGGGQQPPPPQQGQQPPPPGGQPAPGGNGQPGQGQGQPEPKAAKTPGGFGQIIPCKPEEAKAQEAEWKMAVEMAATAAQTAGKLPGYLSRLIEEVREAKVDWRELLRAFLSNQVPSDFTWSRPSKRTLSQGIYLPSQIKEGLGKIVFLIDMSGSCLSYTESFCDEIGTVHQDLKPELITLLTFDTRVHDCGEFGPGDDITFNLKGGGGTDFRPIFDRISEMDAPPKAVVILTDLLGAFPSGEPDYPVLWISTRRGVAPFGETARIEL